MAFEKLLAAQPPQAFTANGTAEGRIQIAAPWKFKVRQKVTVRSGTQVGDEYQVKRVESTALFVGPEDNKLDTRSDLSAFLVADSAEILSGEQHKPGLQPGMAVLVDDAEHEEEPTNAKRVMLVDEDGRPIDSEVNMDGSIALKTTAVISGSISVSSDVSDRPDRELGRVTVIEPTLPTITNTTVAAADTEFSIALPANTKRFLVRARGNSRLLFAYIANGTTTANFLTIPKGCHLEEGDVATVNITLYLQSDVNGDVIEVSSWV